MKQRRSNHQSHNVPREVRLIAQVGLVCGTIASLISITLMLIVNHLWQNQTPNLDTRELLGFSIISIIISFPGLMIGVLTVLCSFSLKKMNRSGLWLAYFLVVSWLFPGGVVALVGISSLQAGLFLFGLIATLIGVAIIGSAIAAGVDLYRVRNHFAKSRN